MPRSRVQRIQDSIHGLMEFRGMETVVIDLLRTPEIQRLRRIRQLGLAHLVFPGAEHSRLVHSLGVSYLAILFARHLHDTCRGVYSDELLPKEAAVRDLATAALCHDLGHGAFSHAWEREVIGETYDRRAWASALGLDPDASILRGLKWHELVGQAFIAREDGQLHQLLEQHEAGFSLRLGKLLIGKYYLPYLPGLLRGDIDVDRADFLKRDTQQCGVAYGSYDLNWLISTSLIGQTPESGLVVGFDRKKALRVVEHFLTARRALYENVYYHKTVRCAEGMVSLFLRRLKSVVNQYPKLQVEGFVRPLVKMLSGATVGPDELLSLDDFSLTVLIDTAVKTEKMDRTVADLGRRILERDLLKLVPCSTNRVREFLMTPDAFERIYHAIRPYCPGDPRDYLHVDRYTFTMLSEKTGESSFFVDEDLRATPIRNHESLRPYWTEKEDHIRLFTVREAREDVAALICPKSA
jgi:HD superfamily phosphohydrolase